MNYGINWENLTTEQKIERLEKLPNSRSVAIHLAELKSQLTMEIRKDLIKSYIKYPIR